MSSFKATLRVQANRPPPATDDEWDMMIEMVNEEIYTKSQQVLQDWLGLELASTNTTLMSKCLVKRLCADLQTELLFNSSMVVLQESLVLGVLRHWLAQHKAGYSTLWEASIRWMAPNDIVTPIGWKLDNIHLPVADKLVKDFVDATQQILEPVYHDVVVWNQFINNESNLEIHTYLIGSTDWNDVMAIQNETLSTLNSAKILGQLTSSEHAIAFALHDTDFVGLQRSLPEGPQRGYYQRPTLRELDLMNTTHVAIGLVMLFLAIQIAGVIVVVVRRRKLTREAADKADDDTDPV